MATADLTSYDRATRSRDGSLADGVFISAAMAGAVCGGLAGTGVSARVAKYAITSASSPGAGMPEKTIFVPGI